MKSTKQRAALVLVVVAAALAGCASNMANIPREQKITPVVVYVESCGNYQLDGTLSKYVWDTVEIKYENRRWRMNHLLDMCNKFNAAIASAISAEGINARIVSVTTEEPPTQEVRDRDAVALGATYALYVGKPIFKSILQSSGQRPLTIVAYALNLYRTGRNKPIGTGKRTTWMGALQQSALHIRLLSAVTRASYMAVLKTRVTGLLEQLAVDR